MDSSEEQFQELIANLAVRINKMLSQQSEMACIGLLLLKHGQIDVCLSTSDGDLNLSDEINLLQNGLVEKVKQSSVTAVCLAYPDYENEVVVVYLENHENYCAKCKIPVLSKPALKLDLENIEIEDGETFVFGAGGR